MSPRDVHYVVQQQLRPLQTQNPYRDDFYFHQHRLRKVLEERKAQGGARATAPQGLDTALTPVPKDSRTRERTASFAQENQAKQDTRSKEWNEKFRVLGHSAKRSAFTPKALLAIPSLSTASRKEGEKGGQKSKATSRAGEGGKPFSSRVWRTRQLCDKLAVLLLDFQEVQHLAKVESQGQPGRMNAELQRQLQGLFQQLLVAVGLEGPPSMTDLLKSLSSEMTLLMSVGKGRRLLQRVLPVLPLSERIKLLTQALQYVCRTIPPTDGDSEAELLRDLALLASGDNVDEASEDGGQSASANRGLPMEALLPCVEAMIASAELEASAIPRASTTFRDALGSEPRAKLAHAVMQRGENLSAQIKDSADNAKDAEVAMKWDANQQRFLDLVMQGL